MTSASPLVWPELEDLASKSPTVARGGPNSLLQGASRAQISVWACLCTPRHPASQTSSRFTFNFRDLPSSASHSLNPSPPPAPSFHERLPQGETEIICNAHGLMYVTAGPGCPLSYSHQGRVKEVLRAGDVAQLLHL